MSWGWNRGTVRGGAYRSLDGRDRGLGRGRVLGRVLGRGRDAEGSEKIGLDWSGGWGWGWRGRRGRSAPGKAKAHRRHLQVAVGGGGSMRPVGAHDHISHARDHAIDGRFGTGAGLLLLLLLLLPLLLLLLGTDGHLLKVARGGGAGGLGLGGAVVVGGSGGRGRTSHDHHSIEGVRGGCHRGTRILILLLLQPRDEVGEPCGGGWWEISEDAVRIRAWYGSYQADQCKERMCEINTIWCPRRRNYFQLRAQRASLRLVRDAKDPLTFVEVAQLRGTPVSAAVDFGALSLRGLLFLAEVTELATLCMLSVGAKKTKDSPVRL